jgi:hypothetical protein
MTTLLRESDVRVARERPPQGQREPRKDALDRGGESCTYKSNAADPQLETARFQPLKPIK